jgi:hypothetical protein
MLDTLARRMSMRKRFLITAIRTQTQSIILRRPFHHTAKWLQSRQHVSCNNLFTNSHIIQTRDISQTCLGGLRRLRVLRRATKLDVTARQTVIAFADRSQSLQTSILQIDLQWNETSGTKQLNTRKRKHVFAPYRCTSVQSLLFLHYLYPSSAATIVGPSVHPPCTLDSIPTKLTENGYTILVLQHVA